MEVGTPLLHTWVERAPQHPSAMPSFALATLLLAEAGNMRFPESVSNPIWNPRSPIKLTNSLLLAMH